MFFKWLMLLSVLTCTIAADIPQGMQPLPRLDGRIIGGRPVRITEYPYQVALLTNGYQYCGGSIHSARYIITAAHCLHGMKAAQIRVRAGSGLWRTGGQVRQAETIKIHNKFNPNTMVYDIGLIRLKTELELNVNIKPIALATTTPQTGAKAVVTGWGNTNNQNPHYPLRMRAVDVNIIRMTPCRSAKYNYGNEVKITMLCAAAAKKDSCQGDSGGPLVSGGRLVGVVSWGYGCAAPKYPGVYSNVATLAPWVVANAV